MPDRTSPQDVNGDGLRDLMQHVRQLSLGLTSTSTQLCVMGSLQDQSTFESCDQIRAQ